MEFNEGSTMVDKHIYQLENNTTTMKIRTSTSDVMADMSELNGWGTPSSDPYWPFSSMGILMKNIFDKLHYLILVCLLDLI